MPGLLLLAISLMMENNSAIYDIFGTSNYYTNNSTNNYTNISNISNISAIPNNIDEDESNNNSIAHSIVILVIFCIPVVILFGFIMLIIYELYIRPCIKSFKNKIKSCFIRNSQNNQNNQSFQSTQENEEYDIESNYSEEGRYIVKFYNIKKINNYLKTTTIETDWSCSICIDNEDDDIVRLNCGHKFHRDCITPWLIENQTCPICRRCITF